MIRARLALLRQAQEYFHSLLLGIVDWDDVTVDKPIPVPAVNGNRDQGKVKDLVIAHFGVFRMEMTGPFENELWPLGRVEVIRGAKHICGPLDAMTWVRIAEFIKQQKAMGDDDGTSIKAGDTWGH
jgi:hypothetical protein